MGLASSNFWGERDMRSLMFGLNGANLTTVLIKLRLTEESMLTIPTIGVTVRTVEYKHLRDAVCNLGGRTHIRPLWKNFHPDNRAIIYLVDCSSDRQRIDELKNTMQHLLQQSALRDTVVLVFADKQDSGVDAMSSEQLTKALHMDLLPKERRWRVQSTVEDGLQTGLKWLIDELNK